MLDPLAWLACCVLAAPQPEVADLLYQADFSAGRPAEWQAYDNWGQPDFGLVPDSPLGAGAALRMAFDDTSTVAWFDKGFHLLLPTPLAWSQVDFIRARYQVDGQVSNLRIFCHCDQGGWWNYVDDHPAIGAPAEVSCRRDDLRLAWTDDPSKPAPDKTGRILAIFFSVHNVKPPNSGERFTMFLDGVEVGTWLLPLQQPVRLPQPRLGCYPRSASDDTRRTVVPSDVAVERVVQVRALEPFEALGLSFRTGQADWSPVGNAVAGHPLELHLTLPEPWSDAQLSATLRRSTGASTALVRSARKPDEPATELTFGAAAPEPGSYQAELTLTVDGKPLQVVCAVEVREMDRDALRASAGEADRQAAALAARCKAGTGPEWCSRQPLTTTPQVRDRERVDPAKWTQIHDPVTWDDLGGGFLGGAQCGIGDRDLDTYFSHYDFGRVIKPHLGYFLKDGWAEALQHVAERNLLVTSVWGYVPDTPWNGGFGDGTIAEAEHEQILGLLGRHFLGYEMGEQDGRYVGSYAPRYQPNDRQEAKALYDAWFGRILDAFHHYMVGLGSLDFSHHDARLGHRMIGIEAAQGLPSDLLEWSFLRGASKQYGVLTWNCISVFNRWGYKSYTSTGDDHGPDKGTSVSLMRRLWYATWLYGSAINMFESAYFLGENDEAGYPKLSPVGQCNVDGVAWAKAHPDRGVTYAPVAVMLDKDAGWVVPRHLYTGKRNLVWGNLPYDRGDDATDAFFRWVWPHYEDCSYYPDERGFLTSTPYGDMFDVVLSDAPDECLRRYQTVLLLGEVQVDADLAERLKRFVAGGGEVIADATAAAALGSELTGLELTRERRAAQRSVLAADGTVLEEEPYTYLVARPQGAVALALSEQGDGLIFEHRSGQGQVVVCTVPCYVAAETEDPQEGVDVPLRHKLLRAFQAVLEPYLRSLALVQATGSPVQVVCNVGQDPGRLLLGVINNETTPAEVTLAPREGTFAAAEAWLGEVTLRDGNVLLSLPAGELAVVEVRVKAEP